MCGILGIVQTDGNRVVAADRLVLGRLLRTLAARGPDGSGLYTRDAIGFGHHRLAIRDREQGNQPWSSPDGSCVLVYNGELYNDCELRTKLSSSYSFKTRCDTEVVMAAYLHWGRSCIDRFRGMFAFGLYDFRDRALWLVRDRFGIKPLYFANIGNQFVFASQVSTIAEHPKFTKEPDWDVVSHYLSTTRLTLGSRTLYKGISQLQPAEELTLTGNRVNTRRYWHYPVEKSVISYDNAIDQLQDELKNSVEVRLASDVEVGMFLSGGVDSSTIAALVHQNDPSSRYATCAAAEVSCESTSPTNDELSFAKTCADQVGAALQPVHVDSQGYMERWHDLVRDFRLPLSTPSDVMIHEIASAAKQHVGVVLGGEGSDELFCGYEIAHWSGYDYDATRSSRDETTDSTVLRSIMRQYGRSDFSCEADHYFALNSLLPTAAKPKILNQIIWGATDNDSAMFSHYQGLFDAYRELSTVEKNAVVLHQVNLESLLSRLDSATMHAGLEARVPFTDHKLVESMFRLPFRYRIDVEHGINSRHLASAELAAEGRLRPKRILRAVASRLLPSELATRKKASFPTGVQSWFQTHWASWVSDYLARSPFAKFLLADSFRAELIRAPQRAGMWLWPITNLAIWGDSQFFGSA